MIRACLLAVTGVVVSGSAAAAPHCDDGDVLAALRSAYAGATPGSLWPQRPPLQAIRNAVETGYVERDGGRFVDLRFCKADTEDATGKDLGLRYVLKGKKWELLTGHAMEWCATDLHKRMTAGDAPEFDYETPECRNLTAETYNR